ncbi:MAG: hypothetical protein AAF726_25135 [Planctomycetota bacterium]
MRLPALALSFLCVLSACKSSDKNAVAPKIQPPDIQITEGTIELRCSLMIDFPGDLVHKYKEIEPIALVRHGITAIGELGLDKGNPSGVLHTVTVPMQNGIVDPVVVRGELDKMVAKYHALKSPGDVEFKLLEQQFVPIFAGTPYAKDKHYCLTIDEIRTLRSDLGVVGGLHVDTEISCVRYVWRDGRFLAIYNYVILPKDEQHLPVNMNVDIDGTDVQLFKETAPVYCAVAEFDVQ